MKLRAGIYLFTGILLVCATTFAWDTRVEEGYPKRSWFSAYQSGRAISLPEHTSLSDMALKELGLYELFGRHGKATMTLVDLNASEFRKEILARTLRKGDDPKTLLEERKIPTPAHFSGLPDYSYTLYDWLNKNVLCPALPETGGNNAGACHTFAAGWLGDLNAIHFGSQATKMYAHYHFLAVRQAVWARTLRQRLKNSGQATLDYWGDAAKEAELLAMTYEGYGQHFLQDRWAIGHMWERWSAPDYTQLPIKGDIPNHTVSAIAGLLHGSESVLNGDNFMGVPIDASGLINAADPMSSPVVHDGVAIPMQWRHDSASRSGDKGVHPGVGDERLNDMKTGFFGSAYHTIGKDYPFSVDLQKKQMLECSKAGWAEVVSNFHKHGGVYGEWGARLPAGAPAFDVLKRKTCWDMWATNESMYTGLVGDQLGDVVLGASILSRVLTFNPVAKGLAYKYSVDLPSETLVATYYTIWREAHRDPMGSDLAQGKIGSLMGFETGNHYSVPEYVEPFDRNDLIDEDVRGRDRQTIFGVFNRGNADHWCKVAPDLLTDMREAAQGSPQKKKVCEYLASVMYQGTEPKYDGSRKEIRQDDKEQDIRSICLVNNVDEKKLREKNPIYLEPGYVEEPQKLAEGTEVYGYQSIRNWCDKVPVFSLHYDPKLANDNVIAIIDRDTNRLELGGYNFGEQQGKLHIAPADGAAPPNWDIELWMDNSITLSTYGDKWQEGDYRIEITTSKGKQSVGMFRLRAESEPEEPVVEVEPLELSGNWPCGPAPDDVIEQITISQEWIDDDIITDSKTLLAIIEMSRPSIDKIVDTVREQAACVRQVKVHEFDVIAPSHGRMNDLETKFFGTRDFHVAVGDLVTPELDATSDHLRPIYDNYERHLEAIANHALSVLESLEVEHDSLLQNERMEDVYMDRFGKTVSEVGAEMFAKLPGDLPHNPFSESSLAKQFEIKKDNDHRYKQDLKEGFDALNQAIAQAVKILPRWRVFDRYARTLLPLIYKFEPHRQSVAAEIQSLILEMQVVHDNLQQAEPGSDYAQQLRRQFGAQEDRLDTEYAPCFSESLLQGMEPVAGGSGPFIKIETDINLPYLPGSLRLSGPIGSKPTEEQWQAVQKGLYLPDWAGHECRFWRQWYGANIAAMAGNLTAEVEPSGKDVCAVCEAKRKDLFDVYARLREHRSIPVPLADGNMEQIMQHTNKLHALTLLLNDKEQAYDNCQRQCRGLAISTDIDSSRLNERGPMVPEIFTPQPLTPVPMQPISMPQPLIPLAP